jgi:hypothetical protein
MIYSREELQNMKLRDMIMFYEDHTKSNILSGAIVSIDPDQDTSMTLKVRIETDDGFVDDYWVYNDLVISNKSISELSDKKQFLYDFIDYLYDTDSYHSIDEMNAMVDRFVHKDNPDYTEYLRLKSIFEA